MGCSPNPCHSYTVGTPGTAESRLRKTAGHPRNKELNPTGLLCEAADSESERPALDRKIRNVQAETMKTSGSFWPVALILSVLSFAGVSAQAGLVVFGDRAFTAGEHFAGTRRIRQVWRRLLSFPIPALAAWAWATSITCCQPGGAASSLCDNFRAQTVRPLGGLFLPRHFPAPDGWTVSGGGRTARMGLSGWRVAARWHRDAPGGKHQRATQLVSPVLAPAGFGSVAGQVLATNNRTAR